MIFGEGICGRRVGCLIFLLFFALFLCSVCGLVVVGFCGILSRLHRPRFDLYQVFGVYIVGFSLYLFFQSFFFFMEIVLILLIKLYIRF